MTVGLGETADACEILTALDLRDRETVKEHGRQKRLTEAGILAGGRRTLSRGRPQRQRQRKMGRKPQRNRRFPDQRIL